MTSLDLGAGPAPFFWMPGADICEHNLNNEFKYPKRNIFSDLKEVIKEKRVYDVIFMSHSLRYNDDMKMLVQQIKEVTKTGSCIEIIDYLERWNHGKGDLFTCTEKEYYKQYIKPFTSDFTELWYVNDTKKYHTRLIRK